MTQISGTNERFLQKEVVLSEMMRIMEPELVFLDVIPYVDSGGEAPVYTVKNSKSADAKKQTPRLKTPSSRFPEVEISRITKKSAVLSEEGLSIRLDKDAIQKKSGVDMIMDAFQTVGFWIAEYTNTRIYTALRAGGTDAGIAPTAVWSAATATPVRDIRVFRNAMRREGYPYRMTNIYMEGVNFEELEGFLGESEFAAYRDAASNVNSDQITIPISGKPVVRGLQSGITHGDILGLDSNHPAGTMFYNNDPQFSIPSISFDVTEGAMAGGPNKVTSKSVKNFGLSTHRYFEDDTHDTVIQIWVDNVVVVKDAYGILYDNGF